MVLYDMKACESVSYYPIRSRYSSSFSVLFLEEKKYKKCFDIILLYP